MSRGRPAGISVRFFLSQFTLTLSLVLFTEHRQAPITRNINKLYYICESERCKGAFGNIIQSKRWHPLEKCYYVSPLTERWGHLGLPSSARLSPANMRRWPKLVHCWLAHRLRRWPSIKPALFQCFVFAGSQSVSLCWEPSVLWVCLRFISLQCFLWYRRSNTRRWPNAGLMLSHRLWHWANISPVLGYRVVFGITLNVGQRHRRRANINPALVQSIVPILYRQHAGTAEWSTD